MAKGTHSIRAGSHVSAEGKRGTGKKFSSFPTVSAFALERHVSIREKSVRDKFVGENLRETLACPHTPSRAPGFHQEARLQRCVIVGFGLDPHSDGSTKSTTVAKTLMSRLRYERNS